MLSLAWLTVFIIFVYVPGSKLNVIESSSSLLLSKSDSEAKSDTSTVALVSSSLVPGDDYAKEKLILRTNNKTGALTALNVITATATAITRNTTAEKFQEQHTQIEEEKVSDNAHSVITKDPSSSPSSSSLSSSSLLNIQLKQTTTSTSETPTTTNTTTAIITRTTTSTSTTTETAIRTWNILNDIGDNKNYNGQRSNSIYWQQEQEQEQQQHQPPPLPPPSAQQQKQQHIQLALSPGTQSLNLGPGLRNTTVLPIQLTETIQNTASVIIRGNSLNWGYVELASASSESPPILISTTRPEAGITRLPLSAAVPQPSSTSSASFVLSLSPSSSSYLLSSSESPLPSSALPTISSLSSTASSASVSVSSTSSTSRTTTSTTTPKSPSLSSTDGYLNITSQAGTHAYLPCNVKQLVKKPISWLRVRDGHILTVDQTTFIADQRFQSIYTPNPERWSLQIKYVQTKDAGTYECQVSTEPKTSAIVSLNIVEPKTELIGESNRHVKAGSQVKLRCIISQALEPPLYINWYHNRQQIFLHNRKGWRTEIERDASGTANGTNNDKQSTIASLIIPSVGKKDSGNYTCSPSNSEPITVVLHVLNGEYSASAITSGCRSNSTKDIQGLLHTLLWVISFVMCFGQLRHPYSRLLLPQSRRTSLTAPASAPAGKQV